MSTWPRISWTCPHCVDTGLIPVSTGIALCRCPATGPDAKPAIALLQLRVQRLNLSATPWDQRLVDCARFLAHGSQQTPIPSDFLEFHLEMKRRGISGLISTLKKEWKLPIVARREDGYWIAATLEEFELNERPYRSQAFTMLTTSYALRRANYPDFSGQTFFDFLKEQEGLTQCQ